MINEKELELINNLKSNKKFLEGILKGFEKPRYIRNRIGLVKEYMNDNRLGSEIHEDAQKLDNYFKEILKKYDRFIAIEIKAEIQDINGELSKYIIIEDKNNG